MRPGGPGRAGVREGRDGTASVHHVGGGIGDRLQQCPRARRPSTRVLAPLATAGLMSVWRAFYTTYLDIFHMRSLATARGDRQREMQHFVDALRSAMLLSLACCVVLQASARLRGLGGGGRGAHGMRRSEPIWHALQNLGCVPDPASLSPTFFAVLGRRCGRGAAGGAGAAAGPLALMGSLGRKVLCGLCMGKCTLLPCNPSSS